jgi:aminoglycoside phosphotransferase (APT) family kinase protein
MVNAGGSASPGLDGARLLDSGAEAEIYEWGEGRVLRLLREDAAARRGDTGPEVAAMRAASDAGVPVPGVYDVIEVDGRPGIVMDRVDGGSMGDAIVGRPWQVFKLTRRFAEIQAALHGLAAPAGMTSTHERAAGRIARLPDDEAALRRYGEGLLGELPAGEALLHGDFHPLNLLMAASGPVVIDWPNASAGPPEADVAMTSLLIEVGTPPNGMPFVLGLIGLFRKRVFIPRYLAYYAANRPLDRELVERWRIVCAIQRLAAGPPGERPALLAILREAGAPV